MPIDYSKFDKIKDSDDEASGEESEPETAPSKATEQAAVAVPEKAAESSEKPAEKEKPTDTVAEGEPSEEVIEFVLSGRYGDLEDVQAAIASGINVDARSTGQATALLMASANGHTEVVKELLKAKAAPELANEAGNRPLHWGALNGHVEVCKALLEHRADANVRNEFQRRPFEEALGRKHEEVCELIAKHTDFSKDADVASEEDANTKAEAAAAKAEAEADAEADKQAVEKPSVT
eukprot:TRINITY_DN21475_c0_g1_i1.p1 TRINITY_DN21475_c0_g1~~TRINITY_DN21475_c0_g1_i1.p1  ORF type:complete len:250 (-),score=83.65 TRINITY_DN21475_c0_g1_i1:136-843(-)